MSHYACKCADLDHDAADVVSMLQLSRLLLLINKKDMFI
jgi:hypothetical protein